MGRTGRPLSVLFIDSDDERLERRYTEADYRTLSPETVLSWMGLSAGWSPPRRDRADLVFDTSLFTAADLKRPLTVHFALAGSGPRIFVTSFAYRQGIPLSARHRGTGRVVTPKGAAREAARRDLLPHSGQAPAQLGATSAGTG